MANDFSDIPDRGYTTTDPSWWNSLKLAGMKLQAMLGFGTGALVETAFTFANAQGSAADVTGLLFSSSVCKSANVWISSRRKTDTNTLYTEIELWLSYNALTSSWQVSDQVDHGDPSGLTLSITAGGQVQYTSDSLAGSNYSGASKYKAFTTV